MKGASNPSLAIQEKLLAFPEHFHLIPTVKGNIGFAKAR
jgi:hypothetical protein